MLKTDFALSGILCVRSAFASLPWAQMQMRVISRTMLAKCLVARQVPGAILIFKLPTVAGTVLKSVIQETKVEISKVAKEKDLSELTNEFHRLFFLSFLGTVDLFSPLCF